MHHPPTTPIKTVSKSASGHTMKPLDAGVLMAVRRRRRLEHRDGVTRSRVAPQSTHLVNQKNRVWV